MQEHGRREPAELIESGLRAQDYLPISDYALIGDCRTAALVSRHGSIDWLCLPHFSGPSVFARILDAAHGGHFSVRPAGAFGVQRRYRDGTNILETRFRTASGVLCLTDSMPVQPVGDRAPELVPQRELLRVLECTEGEVEVEISYRPRPDYARGRYRLERRGAIGWLCKHRDELFTLHADVALEPGASGCDLSGRVRLRAGDKRYLSLSYVKRDIAAVPPLGAAAEQRLARTARWWRDWADACIYDGPYREAVVRSALTLKLMSFELSGAVVAAPTASLPEQIGGVRNWDYRYCWLRDAALTLRAFMELGYGAEGSSFVGWLLHATRLSWPGLQVLYDVYGESQVPEYELAHLEGYCGSRPVRIGNGAHDQTQLDVYGELILAAENYVRRGGTLDRYEARLLVGFGKMVCRVWDTPDHGIWEVRSGARHHTYSKLMCWVALDRLIRLHEAGHLRAPVDGFRKVRTEIRAAIEARSFNPDLRAYVATFDGDTVDASLLLLTSYGFTAAHDRRMRGTFTRIERDLAQGPLVYRYRTGDGLPPGEGAFVITSFWAVEYLARLGRLDEARARFEQLLSHANDLGLYAEEIDPETGAALGNFPQAFSHVGLINAALSIEAARVRPGPVDTQEAM